jgi:hypothetical protein
MEVLRKEFPTLSQEEIAAAFERVAVQAAEVRRKQPNGGEAELVRSKSAAAQTDAGELWRTTSEAMRTSTRRLLSEARGREAGKYAAAAADRVQAAEAELAQIAKLLAQLPGGADVAASLLATPLVSEAPHKANGSRGDLAHQAATDLSRAEALAEALATQLAAASQT